MRASRWKEIDGLFEEVLDLSADRRRAFLEELSRRDPELHRAVRELLEAAEASDSFLETPVDRVCAPPWDEVFGGAGPDGAPERPDRSGERIGPYRLVRRLGYGGMATVYLAERADGLWEQQVALKLIRAGLDRDDVVRRFLAERQILSSLRHPNIARLLDGGTTDDGLPYLVVELVQGTPITTFCDERRLQIEERIRLFCEVARAVQHAHRSLVVHRDLKPSNILVTDEGAVKLLDFGIAKLLEPEADGLTRPGLQPLTPECASPEQLAGGTITTASDVFQLGALLYRLLCGRRPHASTGTGPLGARIRLEESPDPPSRRLRAGADSAWVRESAAARGTTAGQLARSLQGDLDTIVMKALRREPEERYASVGDLLLDLERHTQRLPIRARPATRRYRIGKFLRRNPWVAPVAAATLVAAGLYTVTMHRHARALERERNLARAEAERAEEIRAFMADLFRSADPYAPADPDRGREITVVEALEIGAERVRTELVDRPGLQAGLFGAIADVYGRLDLPGRAVPVREEALRRAREAHGERSSEVTRHLWRLGTETLALGQRDSADALLRSALDLADENVGEADTVYAGILTELGTVSRDRGEYEQAARHLERAVAILDSVRPPASERLALALGALTTVYPDLDRPDEAVRAGQRALDVITSAVGPEHPRTALATVQLASTYDFVGRSQLAMAHYREAVPILERTLGPGHSVTVSALNNLAFSHLRLEQFAQAEAVLRRVLEIRVGRGGERNRDVGDLLQNLATALSQQGKLAEAERTLRRAHEIYVEVLPPGHHLTAFPLLTLAEIQLRRGAPDVAVTSASRATSILREALPDGHFATAVAECRLGRALAGTGRPEEATVLLERAAGSLMADPRSSPRHETECLEAAETHLRSIETPPERWAPFAERLAELAEDGASWD